MNLKIVTCKQWQYLCVPSQNWPFCNKLYGHLNCVTSLAKFVKTLPLHFWAAVPTPPNLGLVDNRPVSQPIIHTDEFCCPIIPSRPFSPLMPHLCCCIVEEEKRGAPPTSMPGQVVVVEVRICISAANNKAWITAKVDNNRQCFHNFSFKAIWFQNQRPPNLHFQFHPHTNKFTQKN